MVAEARLVSSAPKMCSSVVMVAEARLVSSGRTKSENLNAEF
jgi:hypothetical protein